MTYDSRHFVLPTGDALSIPDMIGRDGGAAVALHMADRAEGSPAWLAWRAATEFADADVSVAIAGEGNSTVPPTVFGVSLRNRTPDRTQTLALLTYARKKLFVRSSGNETVLLDSDAISELAELPGLQATTLYTEMALRRIDTADHSRFVVAFFRSDAGLIPFDAATVERAADILFHFARLQRLFEQGEQQRRLLRASLSALAMPVLVVDRQAILRYTNAEGARILKSSDVLFKDGQGRLGTLRPGTTKLLRQLIAAEHAAITDHVCGLVRSSGERMLLALRCLPEEGGGIITVLHDANGSKLRLAAFFEAAGLLKSEARFLEALDNNGSVAEAAEALDLSEATGRTYTKRILSKLGLRNQLELGQFVGRSAPPFRKFGAPATLRESRQ